jgi:subtilase family serine protease
VVVEARSAGLNDLLAAVNVARYLPGVSVVSMSWGMGEFAGQTSLDSYFTTPANHNGVTFIAASGDDGPFSGAEWPSSSANVLGVGGTSLIVGAGGGYVGEAAWSGSGGGVSQYVSEPSYQRTLQTTGLRTAPDVAFDGDPATGVSVYTTDPRTGRGAWQTVGGTSVGAPAWAGLMAIVNEGRALLGKASLDGVSQTLPMLYNLSSADFHRIGSITSTGLGTPNATALVRDMVLGITGGSATTTSGSTTTTTATTTPVVTRGGLRRWRWWLAMRHPARAAATTATASRPAQAVEMSVPTGPHRYFSEIA